ncbi:NUDIX domain-containing protein [Companilactobacillus allii]|uniref:ADP-ribose pyrophosphatase n=1 Tax=Companilactobacillus allii TaxID=1847728 RepID=A0A1P8Q1L4_9LACO|nr:NUDIX domain-containing protein [Companilactobacillus allii]APX71679.1 ADP-ribose pyrophosphatase [Companilactobacillus allii]USQ68764.1 NUDIX domain-containing protein [Companilactobacillus allii]
MINRPLISITNVIWSFDSNSESLVILLLKRSQDPYKGKWGLPMTYLREDESADKASLRLVREKIGVDLPTFNTEQLMTFTNVNRVVGERALSLTYMIYLPNMPELVAGYGADDARWFKVSSGVDNYSLSNGDIKFETLSESISEEDFYMNSKKTMVADHELILRSAFTRIRNRLDYKPTILLVLGSVFTLRLARIIYSIFLRIPVDEIDNSNFRKTHGHMFSDMGYSHKSQSGRPAKIYQLK